MQFLQAAYEEQELRLVEALQHKRPDQEVTWWRPTFCALTNSTYMTFAHTKILKPIDESTWDLPQKGNENESPVGDVIEGTIGQLSLCGIPVLRGAQELFIPEGEQLGAGTFGKVVPAADAKRWYALKLLPFGSKSERSRAMWEIIMAREAGLEDGVAEMLAVQFVPPDVPSKPLRIGLVMPMFALGSMGQLLQVLHKRSGLLESMDVQVLYAFVYDVLKALVSIHDKAGIVHLDIKPDNVLLSENGQLMLCDFGLAERESDLAEITGGCVGTPGYAAPEARDLTTDCHSLSFAADVYSAGKLIKEILSDGEPPRLRSDVELSAELRSLRKRYPTCREAYEFGFACVEYEWPNLEGRGLDDDIVVLVENMLHEDPQQRPTAQEALDVVQDTVQRRWAGWRAEDGRLPGKVWRDIAQDVVNVQARNSVSPS